MKRTFQAMPHSLFFLSIALFGAGYAALSLMGARDGQGRGAETAAALMSYKPLVSGGRVYYSGRDGTAFALDAASGRVIWRQGEGRQPDGKAARPATGALGQGMFFAPGVRGEVVAMDAVGGEVRWRQKVSEAGAPVGALVYSGDTVFVPLSEDILALEAKTGRVRWRMNTEGEAGAPLAPDSSLAVDPVSHLLFFSVSAAPGGKASLVAVDARTGEMRWKQAA